MITFGDDSGFDWGSLLTSATQAAGQVASAVIIGQNKAASNYTAINPATGQPYNAINPATGLPYPLTTTSTGISTSTILLLAAAGLAVFLLMKKKGRR
jgi:hypothetical protein